MLTEGRTHGRRRVGLASLQGQLDDGGDFFSHRFDGRDSAAVHPKKGAERKADPRSGTALRSAVFADLGELELHRGFPAKDRQQGFELAAIA